MNAQKRMLLDAAMGLLDSLGLEPIELHAYKVIKDIREDATLVDPHDVLEDWDSDDLQYEGGELRAAMLRLLEEEEAEE